jgi:coproporphyrinogen III oxidase-like Fe-S oxidoreductase
MHSNLGKQDKTPKENSATNLLTAEQLPYTQLAHWPPLTYRNNPTFSSETINAFTDYLKTENNSKQPKELQPWIPFCESKCTFCYFPVNCERQTHSTYIKALKKALQFYSKNGYIKSSIFNELYVGGGTPSVLLEEQIADLLDYCGSNFNFSKDCQTKFTACTTSLTDSKIQLLSTRKVDQLDIGIQTFDDKFRKILMLRDKSANAQSKVKAIKKAGLGVSIDLLYNLPGQTLGEWERDIRQALELEVESIDCYPLDLYEYTPLARSVRYGRLETQGDYRVELEMHLKAYQIFQENGYLPTCHNRFSRMKEDFTQPSSEVVGTGAGFFMGTISHFQYHDVENVQEYITSMQNNAIPPVYVSTFSKEDE